MQQIIIILSKITTGVRKGFKRRTKCNPCTYLILRGKVSKHRGFNWQNCFNVRPVLSSPSLQQFQTSPNLSCTHECFICPRLGFCLILFIFSQTVELLLGKKAPGRRMFCNFKEKRLHKFEKQFFFQGMGFDKGFSSLRKQVGAGRHRPKPTVLLGQGGCLQLMHSEEAQGHLGLLPRYSQAHS